MQICEKEFNNKQASITCQSQDIDMDTTFQIPIGILTLYL
jgi:hypothetical protein